MTSAERAHRPQHGRKTAVLAHNVREVSGRMPWIKDLRRLKLSLART